MSPQTLWRNAHLALCDSAMRVIDRGAILTRGSEIVWVGEESEAPLARDARPDSRAAAEGIRGEASPTEVVDLGGAWVTPGLIDCHTHLVFAGTRADEYAERLRGVSYAEIARRGGGILSTMRAVRAASEQQLVDESAPRLRALLAEGVTTVEIKSGYGLTLADERKMLRAARALQAEFPVTVRATLLAAHTVPPEFQGRPDDYIDTVAREWLPALHAEQLVDAVDVFCETIGFSVRQCEHLFLAARDLGLPVKMHAEQLSRIGGTQLATRHRALSCDHLEHATVEDAESLARNGCIAVLLPIAFYCLADTHKPPVGSLRDAGCDIALATDCNPGSAPGASLLLAMSMATRLFGLTALEALAAVTRNAARALGVHGERGELAAGEAADFVAWNVGSVDELGYWVGFNPRRTVVQSGRVVL